MVAPQISYSLSGQVYGGTPVSAYTLMCRDTSGFYVPATAANRALYGRSVAMSLTAYSGGLPGGVQLQHVSVVDIGLNVGAGAESWLRASATGGFEKFTPTNDGTSDIVGRSLADGSVVLMPGIWTETLAAAWLENLVLAAPGATLVSSSGVAGPRVVGASTFDGGDPVGKGYVFSAVYNSVTASTTTIQLAALALAAGEGLAFDAKISCRTSSTLGRYKRACAYQRIGSAAPTIVDSLEQTTDQGTGGTVAVSVSGNIVSLNVTPADATNRLWLVELSVHRLPAVT